MENQLKNLAVLVRMLNEKVEKKVNQELKTYGVTVAQFQIVALLYDNKSRKPEYTMKELEHAFQFSQQTIAGTVLRLERKKLVHGFHDPSDRRVKKIRLTERGMALGESAMVKFERMEKWLEQSLSKEELRVTITSLRKLYNRMP